MSEFNMNVTPEIENLTEVCKEHSKIDPSLYGKYDVKRGLRDLNGKGVLAVLHRFPILYLKKWWTVKKSPVKVSYIIGELTLKI